MPANEKKVFFRRNLLGGFNRADVIDYLASQSRDQISERDSLKRELNEKTQKNKELSERLANYESEFVRLNKLLVEKESICTSADMEIESLKKQLDKKNIYVSRLEEELARANEDKNAAEQKLESIFAELRAVAGGAYVENTEIAVKEEQISQLKAKVESLTEENAKLVEKLNRLSELKNELQSFLGVLDSETRTGISDVQTADVNTYTAADTGAGAFADTGADTQNA